MRLQVGRQSVFHTCQRLSPQERARRCRVKNQSRRTRSPCKRFPAPFHSHPCAGFLPSPKLFVLVRLDNEQPIRRRASPLSATVDFVSPFFLPLEGQTFPGRADFSGIFEEFTRLRVSFRGEPERMPAS